MFEVVKLRHICHGKMQDSRLPQGPKLDSKETHHAHENRKNNVILIMTPEKQGRTSELSKHWSPDSTPARNEVIMKTTYPVNR